jgi:hypothetical protein
MDEKKAIGIRQQAIARVGTRIQVILGFTGFGGLRGVEGIA